MTDFTEENGQIPNHVFRYVERELYLYRVYKASVEELKWDLEDIMNRSRQFSVDPIPSNRGQSDTVSLTIVQAAIIENKIQQKLTRIRKIEAGLQILTDEEREIVETKYFSNVDLTNEQIIAQLNINRNRFYKLRYGIVYKFAMVFGVL